MKSPSRNYRYHYLYCAIFVFLLTPRFANAQSAGSVPNPSSSEISSEERSAARASSSPATLDDRLKMLEEQVRQQNAALNEMRALIVGQQRIIDALTASTATNRAVNQSSSDAVASTSIPNQTQSSAPDASAQTPTLDDRVKKLENKVLAIGHFRLSGDFRLRF